MEPLSIQIRPIVHEDIGLLEEHMAFDWANLGKHRQRFLKQEEDRAVYLIAWEEGLPVGHLLVKWQKEAEEPLASELEDCPDLILNYPRP